jgi:hypothetical protein
MINNNLKQLSTERWASKVNYDNRWNERTELLLQIAINHNLLNSINSFTEYGCGPNRPLKLFLDKINFTGKYIEADITKWRDTTKIINLNNCKNEDLEKTDCGVFSGVLEYLDDLPKLFDLIKNKHNYVLFSYSAFNPDYHSEVELLSKIQILSKRANSGWRNHFSLKEFLSIKTDFIIIDTGYWNGQALFVLAHKNLLNLK